MAEYKTTEQQLLEQDYAKPRDRSITSVGYKTLEYPDSLGTHRYPHFAVFFINANSRSQFLKERGGKLKTVNVILGAKTEGVSLPAVAKKSTTVATAMGVVGGPASHKRIMNAICLPMPQKVKANYEAGYTATEEVGMFGAILAAASSGQGMVDAGGGVANLLKQTAAPKAIEALSSAAISLGQEGIAKAAAKLTGNEAIGKAISNAKVKEAIINPKLLEQINSKLFGTVINKRQEQLFQSMKFRSHNMQWIFLPRSKEESNVIFEIIQTFKENMHPELDGSTNNSTLIMPSEFDIEFRTNETENLRINRIATSVLASCSVDYTPVGEFITFSGYSDPVAISLDMIFTELEPLTRRLVSLNY